MENGLHTRAGPEIQMMPAMPKQPGLDPRRTPRPVGAPSLEAQLTEITLEFVARIVTTIRNSTFAEVAGLDTASLASHAAGSGKPRQAPRAPTGQLLLPERAELERGPKAGATSSRVSGTGTGLLDTAQGRRGRRPRQTQEKRGELAERIIRVLATAGSPLGVRALAGELSTSPDLLTLPLRELREQGKIRKLGEKRSTTYSLQ